MKDSIKLCAIKALQRKCNKEAQQAMDAVFKKYNAEMVELIEAQIPNGHTIEMVNGMVIMRKGKKHIRTGKAWGFGSDNIDLDRLAILQYPTEFRGCFMLPEKLTKTPK